MVETESNLEELKEEIRLELSEMGEMLKNIQLAQESITGYKFSCSDSRNCAYCSKKLLSFVCHTVKEAQEHSSKYFVPMWIHMDEKIGE